MNVNYLTRSWAKVRERKYFGKVIKYRKTILKKLVEIEKIKLTLKRLRPVLGDDIYSPFLPILKCK